MIAELIPAKYNPRIASEKEEKDLMTSLERFSLADPIVINKNNQVIGGHFRLRILKAKGINEIDVRVPDRLLSDEEEKELNLRLNKNNGQWDFDLLAGFDKDLLNVVGFSKDELGRIFDVDLTEDDFDAQKEYDKITQPQTKLGDLYQLGGHRLLCGSSADLANVEKLMNGDKAQLIFTDPPYNVNYKPPKAGNGYYLHRYGRRRGYGDGKIFNDNLPDEKILKLYTEVLKNLYAISKDNAAIYWWYGSKNQHINRQAFIDAGWYNSQIIIWLKNGTVFSSGQDYHRCYEPCMFGWKKGKSHYNNKKYRTFKDAVNLEFEDFQEMLDIWFQRRDATINYEHPTQKPVKLAERALKKNSVRGDIVVDLFGGSGSTLIACEQAGRKAHLMELDPKYCDVIVRRWEKFTGKKAVKC